MAVTLNVPANAPPIERLTTMVRAAASTPSGAPVTDYACIYGDGFDVSIDGEGAPRLADTLIRICDAHTDLLAELKRLRDRFHKACLAAGSDAEFVRTSTPGADAVIARAEGV